MSSKPSRVVKVGDDVLVTDSTIARKAWLKGKVTQVIMAKDGQVQLVIVETTKGVFQRPASEVVVLSIPKKPLGEKRILTEASNTRKTYDVATEKQCVKEAVSIKRKLNDENCPPAKRKRQITPCFWFNRVLSAETAKVKVQVDYAKKGDSRMQTKWKSNTSKRK